MNFWEFLDPSGIICDGDIKTGGGTILKTKLMIYIETSFSNLVKV